MYKHYLDEVIAKQGWDWHWYNSGCQIIHRQNDIVKLTSPNQHRQFNRWYILAPSNFLFSLYMYIFFLFLLKLQYLPIFSQFVILPFLIFYQQPLWACLQRWLQLSSFRLWKLMLFNGISSKFLRIMHETAATEHVNGFRCAWNQSHQGLGSPKFERNILWKRNWNEFKPVKQCFFGYWKIFVGIIMCWQVHPFRDAFFIKLL